MAKKTVYDDQIYILNDKYMLLEDFFELAENDFVELDLGCGTGDLAVPLAARYPERRVIAADVMLGRLRKVIRKARRDGIVNLDFFRVEARHLISVIMPENSIDRLHILCPDPWPKHRHKGNRLMSSDFMMHIASKLKKDGLFHFATDDVPYMTQATKNIESSGLFERVSNDFIADISDIKTEFERQWLSMGKAVPHKVWKVVK